MKRSASGVGLEEGGATLVRRLQCEGLAGSGAWGEQDGVLTSLWTYPVRLDMRLRKALQT